MNLHKNARLTPKGREILVRRMLKEGLRAEEAAQAAGVSVRTAYKWLARYRTQGLAGLQDRCSRPHRSPHRTDDRCRVAIMALRRARCTYREISRVTGVAHSTVGRIIRQAGLNRLSHLEPPVAANRYVFPRPGDLLHLDIKRLGRFRRPGHRVTANRRLGSRGAGWEYVHIAIDDHSRVSFACIHPNETGASACQTLPATLRYFQALGQTLGVTFTRVMTDNGSCYRSQRFARLCRRLKLRHIKTRPYTPRTNGKAERFIQTALHEWAYARAYGNSDERGEYLPVWLHRYNWHRPHASLKHRPPIQSLNLPLNNVVGLHS